MSIMDRIPEADWKIFKKHHLIAHEMYCQTINAKIADLMGSMDLSVIEKFQAIAHLVNQSAKEEDELFVDYRRSTALFCLLRFFNEGLLTREQIEEYSPKVKDWLRIE